MSNLDFDRWFKAQFGRLPLPPHARAILMRRHCEARDLEARLAMDIRLDDARGDRYDAALKAVQAAEKPGEFARKGSK